MTAAAGFVISIMLTISVVLSFYLGYLAGEGQYLQNKKIENRRVLENINKEIRFERKEKKDDITNKPTLNQVIGKNKITFDGVYEVLKTELPGVPEEINND